MVCFVLRDFYCLVSAMLGVGRVCCCCGIIVVVVVVVVEVRALRGWGVLMHEWNR